jgi:hypothetical protein
MSLRSLASGTQYRLEAYHSEARIRWTTHLLGPGDRDGLWRPVSSSQHTMHTSATPRGLQLRQHSEPDRASPPPALRRRRPTSVTARRASGIRGAISTPARSGVREVRSGPGLTRTGLRVAAHWRSAQRRRSKAKLIAVLGDIPSRDGESVCAEPLRELSVASGRSSATINCLNAYWASAAWKKS